MNKQLEQIGIKSKLFKLYTVNDLINKGIIEKPLDGNHGEIHPKGEDFVPSGIPFIMAADISNGNVDYDNCKYITKKQADSLRKGFSIKGDILLTHKATIGRTAIVNYTDYPYIMLTPQVTYYRVKDHNNLNRNYLRCFFESDFFQKTFKLWAGSGSTRAYLGITEQKKLPVVLPPLPIQKKIAAILTAYDDLIENNNRRIAILEKIAEEIYREWFVRMRFPGHEKVKFKKGVPEGWDLTPFSKLVIKNPVLHVDKSDTKPYVGMEDLSLTSMIFTHKETRTGSSGSKFQNNDIIFPRITPSLENGKRGYVMNLKENEIGLGSTEFIVFRKKYLLPEFIYFLTCSSEFRKHGEISMAGASGRQRVQEDCFDFFLIKKPPLPILEKFSSMVHPMFLQIKGLFKSTELMKQTRDLLLSRLISGKLSVEDLNIKFPPSMEEADA
jgi:type I restriction enzyme S subunit